MAWYFMECVWPARARTCNLSVCTVAVVRLPASDGLPIVAVRTAVQWEPCGAISRATQPFQRFAADACQLASMVWFLPAHFQKAGQIKHTWMGSCVVAGQVLGCVNQVLLGHVCCKSAPATEAKGKC